VPILSHEGRPGTEGCNVAYPLTSGPPLEGIVLGEPSHSAVLTTP